jgi:hypothetical protein
MSRNYQNKNQHYNQNQNYNKTYKPSYNNKKQLEESSYNILIELKDYMFDSKNLLQFTKHTIKEESEPIKREKPNLEKIQEKRQNKETIVKPFLKQEIKLPKKEKPIDTNYYLKQKDSLFWCFFILKYGLSKYEMEIGNQHFVVEKQEKFHYIETLRQNKELLKIHKIKPLSGIEDDLANKERISIKTFFALCIIENINILLVDKRKIYEIQMNDDPVVNVVHRNSVSYEHYIELGATAESVAKYRETYFKVSGFDDTIKAMSAYKVDELLELCDKLGININESKTNEYNANESVEKGSVIKKVKYSKKDIYEFIVMNF